MPPPPPLPPAGQPHRYRPLRGPAHATVALLVVAIMGEVLSLGSSVAALSELADYSDTTAWDDPALDSLNAREAIIALVEFASFLAAGTAFIVWFHRAYHNVRALWPRHSAFLGTGWAIGGWIVPIVAFWFPYMMMREVWRAGDRDAPPDSADPNQRPLHPVLITWWLLWIFALVTGNAVGRITRDADDVAGRRDGSVVNIVSLSASIPAALLAIWIVRTATRRMNDRATQLWGVPPPG